MFIVFILFVLCLCRFCVMNVISYGVFFSVKIDMVEIKDEFMKLYGKPMSSWIKVLMGGGDWCW